MSKIHCNKSLYLFEMLLSRLLMELRRNVFWKRFENILKEKKTGHILYAKKQMVSKNFLFDDKKLVLIVLGRWNLSWFPSYGQMLLKKWLHFIAPESIAVDKQLLQCKSLQPFMCEHFDMKLLDPFLCKAIITQWIYNLSHPWNLRTLFEQKERLSFKQYS